MGNHLFSLFIRSCTKGKILTFFVGSFGGAIGTCLFGKNFFDLSISYSVFLGISIFFTACLINFLYELNKNINEHVRLKSQNNELSQNYSKLNDDFNKLNENYNKLAHEEICNKESSCTYGQAIIDMKDIISHIHALKKNKNFNEDDFMNAMIQLCNSLKKIFDRNTHANCSVSIKVPTLNNSCSLPDTVLRNLCRDSEHHQRNTTKYNNTKHTIIGNTPYIIIVNKLSGNNKTGYEYVNNNISESQDYLNTSKIAYDGVLPYESEFVYPIRPIQPIENTDFAGFICVDCNEKNKFDRNNKFDIAIMECIADEIYDIMQQSTIKQ